MVKKNGKEKSKSLTVERLWVTEKKICRPRDSQELTVKIDSLEERLLVGSQCSHEWVFWRGDPAP